MNTSGAFKARKAGDTRTEFSAILNSISSILILGAIFFGAFLRHLQRENYQTTMMRKELKKVDEYKENMYFEAVQDILSKISDTKTKGSAKVLTFLLFPTLSILHPPILSFLFLSPFFLLFVCNIRYLVF